MKSLIWSLLGAQFVTGAAWASAPRPPLLAAAEQAIDRAIARDIAAGHIVGYVIAITDRDRMLIVSAHGFADLKSRTPMRVDDALPIGSISKSFTSVALLRLMDQHRFDPALPISAVLPWFATDPRYKPITGSQLMSHTAALPTYRSDMSSSRAAALAMREWVMPYAPGSHYYYSNTGYQILGYALEAIEHRPYRAAIDADVFQPLGMTSTSAVIDDSMQQRLPVSYMRDVAGHWVEAPWFEYAAGDGSVATTASDLGSYVRMLLNRGALPGGRLLSPAAFRALTTPILSDYAFGLRTRAADGSPTLFHGGAIAGFRARIEARPADGFGIVLLSNGIDDPELAAWIVETVHRAYHGEAPTEPPPLPAPPPPAEHFAGTYRDAAGKVLIIRAGAGGLLVDGPDLIALHRIGPDIFAAPSDAPDVDAYIFTNEGVSHGADWFARGKALPVPKEYRALVGHYTSHNPEGPDSRIFVRDGALMLRNIGEGAKGDIKLLPLGNGTYRLAEPDQNPERLRFDTVIEGRALRLLVSGQPVYRVDTP